MIDGPHRSEGILELYFFGQWGGVCGGLTFDLVTADAACVSLGYTRSRSVPRLVGRYSCTQEVDNKISMTYVYITRECQALSISPDWLINSIDSVVMPSYS